MCNNHIYYEKEELLIGKKIYYLRSIKGISAKQIAKMIGVSSQQFYRYEKGINKVSEEKLQIIANFLGKKKRIFLRRFKN